MLPIRRLRAGRLPSGDRRGHRSSGRSAGRRLGPLRSDCADATDSDRNPTAVALQIAPDFAIWDGNQKIPPRMTGLPYHDRAEGGRSIAAGGPEPGPSRLGSQQDRGLAGSCRGVFLVLRSRPIARNPFAFLMRGVARRESGDLDRAMADFDESIRLDPKFVPALLERASLWRAKNQPDRAMADLDQAIQIDGSDPVAFVERAVLYFNMKDYTKSRKDLDRAASLDSRAVIIDIVRGMMDLDKKDTKRAYEAFRSCPVDRPEASRRVPRAGLGLSHARHPQEGRGDSRRGGPGRSQ